MTAGKKWYSLFVVSDDDASGAGAESTEPRRASDLVPDVDTNTGSTPAVPGPAAASGDLSIVYASAQISTPSHGYTVLKVAEMLRSEHLQTLPKDVKRKSIMVALDAAGVKVDEIVQDAVRRDRALDTYERVLQKHVDDARAAAEAENKTLEADIAQRVAELRARIDANTKKAAAEHDEFVSWRARKHQEEDAIADAVGYFVSENPVTTSRATDAAKGDSDVR